jgi:small subunit ribosomal protein S9
VSRPWRLNISAPAARKTSIARVRLMPGSGKRLVNGVDLDRYFSRITLSRQATGPLTASNLIDKFDVHAAVHGGGHAGQAGAICLGVARALQLAIRPFEPSSARRGTSRATRA